MTNKCMRNSGLTMTSEVKFCKIIGEIRLKNFLPCIFVSKNN